MSQTKSRVKAVGLPNSSALRKASCEACPRLVWTRFAHRPALRRTLPRSGPTPCCRAGRAATRVVAAAPIAGTNLP
eukprot:5024996-Prorocentrum_lima.AAC.1